MKKEYVIKLNSFNSCSGWSEDFIKNLVFNSEQEANIYMINEFGTFIDGTNYQVVEI